MSIQQSITWYKVSEKEPPKNEDLLVRSKNSSVYIARYTHYDNGAPIWEDFDRSHNVFIDDLWVIVPDPYLV
jgi:hypothetical protein